MVEAAPVVLMQGIRLVKVHINSRYLWNFCVTRSLKVTEEEVCGQRGNTTCGKYISLERQDLLVRGGDLDPEMCIALIVLECFARSHRTLAAHRNED